MMTDIENLISKMTLDEKISLLAGADLWKTVAIERLGIPSFKVTDGPNGSRGTMGNLGAASVCTPVGIALGATWNTELVQEVGEILGDELKMKEAQILLAPTVNIHRSPIAGRNFECYSEDPYLSGEMATAYINGIQAKGVGTCIKHYVCNDQEFERNSMSSEVEERPLRELYLEPFRKAIKNSKPWSIMSGYNRIRGTYAAENDYTLNDILRTEWNFDGPVISDWYGTYTDATPAGGLDLEMPGPARWMAAEKVKTAIDSGKMSPAQLDNKVRRLLGIIDKAGLFEHPAQPQERGQDRPEHREAIRRAAGEAIVLLKNENAILPIKPAKSIAVIGENARWSQILGGGSSSVTPHYVISPLEGIRSRAPQGTTVGYAPGCFIHRSLPAPDPDTLTSNDGQAGLLVEIFDSLDFSSQPVFTQQNNRPQFGWFSDSVPNVNQSKFAVRVTGFFTPKESGQHTLSLGTVGRGRLFVDGQEAIDNWTEPAPYGQKTTTMALLAGQKYAIRIDYNWEGNPMWRSLSFGHLPPHSADMMLEAVELARHSDIVVVVAGLTAEWESEGFDRVDMKLPGQQDELIARVSAANPNTIVVLNAGSPLEMPWIEQVKAVVQLWYNSQEQGNALADILFGDVNPSGKLPITFPRRLQDNPSYLNFPGENGKVFYGEGLFVGYRYYDKKETKPLFPFGHGLSYTSFAYTQLKINSEFTLQAGLDVSITITNTGKLEGKEIVQLYVTDLRSSLVRPIKELKAFKKISLQPGEEKNVSFHLDQEAFWFYNPAVKNWVTEPGEFDILVGSSSQDIRLTSRTMLTVTKAQSNSRLNTGLPLRTILDDSAGYAAFAKHFGEWIKAPELQNILDMSIDQIASHAPNIVTADKLLALSNDLDLV
jgi:beta-glucosidase